MRSPYTYFAELVDVIDGDTVRLRLDQGFNSYQIEVIRLADVWAAERNTTEGIEAKAFLYDLLSNHQRILCATEKNSKGKDVRSFTRYVGHIWLDRDGSTYLNEYLQAYYLKMGLNN